jgi:hypothetical protein
MRSIHSFFLAAACLVTGSTTLLSAAQYMTILSTNGSIKTIDISSIRKITFNEPSMTVNYQNGQAEAILLPSIQRLSFSPLASLNTSAVSGETKLFPNPASDYIQLSPTPAAGSLVTIYTTGGQKVWQTVVTANPSFIAVSSLKPGLYFIQVGHQVLKFTKQ